MADKIDLLFDDLQARGFAKDKTRDDFRKYMLAPGEQGYKNRKTFFEDFKSQGMTDLNTYEDFRDLMGLHPANPTTGKTTPSASHNVSPKDSVNAEDGYTFTQGGLDSLERGYPVRAVYPNKPQAAAPQQPVNKPQGIGYAAPLRPELSLIERREVERQNNFAARAAERLEQQYKEEENRRNQPLVDTGIESANRGVIKTRGQWEDELNAGIKKLGDFITPMVGEAIKKADDTWLDTYTKLEKFFPPVDGNNMTAIARANEATDPDKILEGLLGDLKQTLDTPEMKKRIKEGADAAGIPVDEYSEQMVAPALMERLVSEFQNSQIARRLPKNTGEYILQGLNNSIIGMLVSGATKTQSQRRYDLEAEAMTEQGQNRNYQPGTGANLARMGITFAADAPFFGLYGKVGGNVVKSIAERQIKNMVAKGLSEGAARSVVGAALEKSAGTRMKNYIMQHVISGSITMGGFNTTSEAVRQMRDSEFKPEQILTSGLEGVATGAAFGLTGGAAQAITQPLTGIAKVGGKIAGFGAEAETLYATEELAKMAHGEDGFTNPFEGSVEALEKLGVMKLSSGHLAGSAANKIARAKEVGVGRTAAETLAGMLGRTRTGVSFTKEEEAYIRNTFEGKNLIESLMNMHPERAIEEINGKKKFTAEGEQMRQQLANNYDDFMQNSEIPYDVKRKVAATLGGLVPDAAHTPLEVSSDIVHNPDGSVILKTRDKDGNCIRDYKFDSFSDAEGWREAHEEQFRLNDAVNMWNESSLESRSQMLGSIMETYQVDAKKARQMVDAALDGSMGTSFDNDMFLTIYSAIHSNAYPASNYNPKRNYWEGMRLDPEQRHQALEAARQSEETLKSMGTDFADEVIGAADFADEKLAELAGREDITGEQLQAAISYYNWKSFTDGMMDEAAKDIDSQVEAANNVVRRNTHPDTGRLIEAIVDDKDCYVTAGHFTLSQDGRLTLTDNTGAIIVRDKNTGEIHVVSPNKVLVTAINDPQRLIDENNSMEGLRGQLIKQVDDSIELAPGTPETPQELGEVFVGSDGKQYVISGVRDEQGNWTWLKIELDNDGEPKGNPQPLDIDEYRKAKSDEIDAANRPQDETAGAVNDQAERTNINENSFGNDAEEEGSTSVDASEADYINVSDGEGGGTDVPPSRTEETASRIPVDEKGNKLYEQAAPEDVLAELSEKYGAEKARQMIAKMAENTAKVFEELSKKDTSKMTDMAELTAHEDALAEAEQKMKYWQGFIKKEEPQQPVSAAPQQPAPAKPVEEAPKQPVMPQQPVPTAPQQPAPAKPAAAPKQPVTPQQPTPAKPVAAPQQPAASNAAERKVYEKQIKKSLGNTFEYARQEGGHVEVTFQRVDHEGKVVSMEQAYDAAGNKVGEPTEKRYDWMQLGKALTEKRLKPVVSVGERLRKIRNVKVGEVPLADVLSEEEQQQLLDAYNRKDKDEISTLEYDLIEAHRKDLILRGRDTRNEKVDKILTGSGTKEEKLKKIRELYKTFDDTSLDDASLYPNTLEEAVAELLGNVPKPGEGTLAYYSYGEGDNKTIGLKDESGYGSRGFSGDTKGFNPWLASNGKGVSLKQFSESLYEQLPEGFKQNITDHDVRNALLSVFGSAEVPSDIPTMVIRRGIIQAENNARRMEEMWIDDAPAFQKVAKDLINDGGNKQDDARETILRDAAIEHLQNNGMSVITDVEQGQKTLDAYNERVKLARSKKRAVETASLNPKEGSPADISTADGAKIQNNLDILAKKSEKFFKTTDGQAYGYTLDGKIYIDPRIANTETPIHEYGHLWATMKRQSSPEEWNSIKSALLGDKTAAPIIDKVRDEYPELSVEGREDDFVEEILTQFSGKRGAERLREIADEVAKENGGIFGKAEAVRAMQRLKNILNSFWESVAKMFGVKYRNANDVADMMMKDFLNGVNPIEGGNGQLHQQRDIERTLMGVHNISEDKLRKAIKQGGLANPSLAVIDTKGGYVHTDYGSISLIPRSSLIDSKTGRNAGTFTADAWTPSYPPVELVMKDKGWSKFFADLKDIRNNVDGGNELASKLRVYMESYLEQRDPDAMYWWYMHDRGLKPATVRRTNPYSGELTKRIVELTGGNEFTSVSELSDEAIKEIATLYRDYKTASGEEQKPLEERITSTKVRINPDDENKVRQLRLRGIVSDLEKYGEIKSNLDNFISSVNFSASRAGEVDDYATFHEAREAVRNQGKESDYLKWLEELNGRYGIEEKIFNGYTPNGNRKYIPNTLENVSKYMKREGLNGATNWSSIGNWIAKVANKEKTLKGIRKHRQNLRTSEEEHDAFHDKWGNIMHEIAIKFGNGDHWVGEQRMTDILDHSDYAGYLKKEYGIELSKEDKKTIDTFIKEVRANFPTGYFETKFERPVKLDEFAIAVVPENTSSDIVDALKNAGLDVRTYSDAGSIEQQTENRRRATMDAVQNRQDIMFQKTTDEIKPVGENRFGGVYDQFRGKVKEAFDFLIKKKEGYLKGVFHRDDLGDIDLAWGSAPTDYTGKGLAHIIRKHINFLKDFKDIHEAMRVIDDVVTHGVSKPNSDPKLVNIEKDNYRVVVAKNEEGNWILSAFDFVKPMKEKGKTPPPSKTPGRSDVEAGAVTSNPPFSEGKDTNNISNIQEKGEKSAAERVAETEIGGALVDRLTDMGMDVSTDWAENRRVLKAAEKDNSEAGKLRRFETPDGKTYGFAYKGKVYLDPRKIDAELPIHEYGHIWCGAFRKLNPKGWQDVVNTMKTDADAWEVVKKLNPKLTDEHDIAEEMISKFSGQKGAVRLRTELAKMSLRDPSYTGRWGNIFKNISKAIQDFWKQMGDFLHIKYTSPEQVYDQVMKDFAERVNPQRMVERYLKERDAEYMKAVEAGDNEKAAEIFNAALRENIGNGITPYLSVDKYFANRELAHAVKTRDKKAVVEVAEKIAPLIPKDAVLVPAPSHTGKATDMLDVANAISEITGVEVADVLVGSERESQYAAKMAGEPISSTEMGITAQGELPAGKIPVVIDNVVDTGNTAEACVKALGKGIVCTLGDSADRYKHVASLKSAEPVVTNRKGNVVPLSERFEMGGSKYLDKATVRTELGVTSTAPAIQEQEAKVNTQPTEAQKEAGNYQKGHIKLDGYDITIENPKGSTRSGVDAQGNRWETEMHNTYGYIRGTEGVDGDHIDVFLSDDPASGSVFVVDQVNPSTGEFDEHKVMYGFPDMASAEQAYLSNYSKGWKGLGTITPVSREEFKKWVESSHRKTKPFAEYKSVKPLGDVQVGTGDASEYRRGDVFDIVDDNNERLSCEVVGVDGGDVLVNVDGYGIMAVEKEYLDEYRQRATASQNSEETIKQQQAEQQQATKVVDQWKRANELLKKNGSDAVSQRATKAVLKALDKAGVKYKVVDSKEEKQMLSLYAQMNQNAVADYARALREDSDNALTRNSRYILYNLDDPFGVPMFFQKQSMARWAMKGVKNLTPEGQWKIIDIGAPAARSNGQTADEESRKAAELMPNIQGMVGWHGSGSKFDHFDHRHMGEGEGNQAYGWGTYITEVEGIGRMYATNVKNSQPMDVVTHNGKEINASDITIPGFDVERKVAKVLARAGGYKSIAISSIENDIRLVETAMSRTNEAEDSDYMKQHKRHIEFWKECIESLKNDEWSYRYRGPQSILYKVDIPDDTGENYFDWTGNVPKERADAILSTLKEKLLADDKYGWNENDASRERLQKELDMMRNYFGETFYGRMATLLGNSVAGARTTGKRLASELLHNNGYIGIKYPAEYRSGGRPDGAKNYVIFDENDAKITGHVEFMQQNKGKQIYGWSDGKSIHLTKAGLNPNTPIHEYTHLWDKYIQESDPELWKKVVSAMKKTDMWQEIRENPGYRNIWNDEDRMASEVHSRLSGTQSEEEFMRAAFKKDTPQAIINEVKSVLRKFWNTLLRLFGKQSKTFGGEYESVDAIIRRPLKDLLEGLNPVEELENVGVNDEWVEPMMMTGEPAPELTPEERQYWNQWSAAMKKWRERNAIPADTDGPGEKPKYQQGQTALDYAKVLMQYNKRRALWETAPKLEDYRQARGVKDAVEVARENEKKYPDSTWAKAWRVSAEMQRIRSAMRTQKQYDKSTVKAVTDLAHDLMTMGFGDNLSRGEMERILSSVKNATGAKDIKKQVDNVMNILIDNQLRNLDQRIVKLSSIKELKQTAQGVEAQGKLELKGQKMIQAFREAREGRMTADRIRERLYEVAERMSNNEGDASMLEQEYEGLMIALQYQENIEGSREDWADLNTERRDAVNDYKASGRSYQAQQELLESLDQAMMENKIERIGMFGDIIGRLEGNISESIQGAKEFVEREKERVKKIHDMANFDTAGKDMGAMRVDKKGKAVEKGRPANFFLQPLGTFEQMLKQFGGRNANGEGYLYDYFLRNWMDATDKAFVNETKAKDELDAKARELFGKGVKRWSDLYEISNKEGAQVDVVDQNEKKTLTLTQGNLLYIYMADKMSDGRMKLRKMGITEEQVEQIKEHLDPRLIQLADWIQDEYLPAKRTEYNKVHERMFGAPMASIDHYFPIKILDDARVQVEDVNVPDSETLPSTITKSIIKRRKNVVPLDILHTDAISVVIENVEDMERWAATAEWNKDVNTLLSYTTFRNKVKNMKTIYGSGDELWNNLKDAAKIAAGVYRPKAKPGSVDAAISNIAKGVTAAKINFRVYTAFKQILSAPAFLHDVNLGYFVKDGLNPYGSWKWAMENMPVFRKRWKSRQIGDTRLMDDPSDWKLWKTNVVQMATRLGMSPNAIVDGVTCAVGAKAIYETRYKKYKQIGATDEVARKRALQDAEIGYNLTQQSSEGAFVSKIQKDRTVAANMLTVFRNSSMSYTRQWYDAYRNLRRRMQSGYKEDSIGFMTRQIQEQFNLNETEARQAAEAEYARAGRRDVARMLNMMFGVTIAWNLGASLPYLLMGDDDKTKKEMMTDALLKGMLAGPVEGYAAGSIYSDFISQATNESVRNAFKDEGSWGAFKKALDNMGDQDINPLPLFADLERMIGKMKYDGFAAAQDVFNICTQSAVGVNPQTFTDMWNACMDYGFPGWDGTNYKLDEENLQRPKEIALFIMRLMNAPTSSWRNKYIDELGMDVESAKNLSYEEMAKRYAHYKHWKDVPMLGWLRGEEGRQAKIEKIQKQFDKAVYERVERLTDKELLDNLAKSTSYDERRQYAKLIHSRIGGNGKDAQNAKEDWQKNYQMLMQYNDIKEDELLSKKKAEAKANGDEKNVKTIEKAETKIREKGKKKLNGDNDAEVMENIRQWRGEALEKVLRNEQGPIDPNEVQRYE